MSDTHCCSGSCGGCSGCARELVLTQGEISLLRYLGQIPFLPIARRADSEAPVYLESNDRPAEEYSLILRHLEKKGLISLDYDRPLANSSGAAYAAYPIHGSMALTARGQQVVDLMDRQGVDGE